MKVSDAIRKRRSVRHYSTKAVKWGDIVEVLDAAKYTPMAGNVFSLRFVVVADKKKKADISTYCLDQYFMQDAPYLIVVCSDLEQVKTLYGELAEEYGTRQAAAAVQNMLLQATELGLASCWIGSFDGNAVRSVLKIPDRIKVETIITLGYSKGKQEMPIKQNLNKFTFFEEYGKPGGWKEKDPHFWGTRGTRFEK